MRRGQILATVLATTLALPSVAPALTMQERLQAMMEKTADSEFISRNGAVHERYDSTQISIQECTGTPGQTTVLYQSSVNTILRTYDTNGVMVAEIASATKSC